jgi:D-alanyl-D-alanine carboxypeptidase (penicillin-binding protein 5/6)
VLFDAACFIIVAEPLQEGLMYKSSILAILMILVLIFPYTAGVAASQPISGIDVFGGIDVLGSVDVLGGVDVVGGVNVLGSADSAEGAGAASNVPAPEISAASAILVEAETGQVLYHKNSNALLHISAACKLMTTLVAIENSDIYSNATVSADAVNIEGSALSLEVGAKYQVADLLYAIMLTSANDAAIAVAEYVSAGDIEKFTAKMRETAIKLNMNRTNFTNPTGLFDEKQYTTAADISLLIRYAIQNPTFNRIFSAKARPWYGTGTETKILTSSNKLFWGYDGVEGGKTGYNKKEQQTVICTANRSNLKLICIVLDAPESTMYSDATSLLDYGFNNFRKSTLVRKGEQLKTSELDGKEIKLVSQSDIMYVHPIGENYIEEFSAEADLKLPLKKTVPVGSAKYILQDGTEIVVSLYPETEIVPPDDTLTKIRKKVIDNKDIFILAAILLVIEVFLILGNIVKLFLKLIRLIFRRPGDSTGNR